MRNNKLWSVLLAAVLLCACVVGVLVIGAQAEGQQYYMTVGDAEGAYADKVSADATFIANYDGIDAAMAAAAAKTDWAAGDSLVIYITSSETTAPAFASGTAGRHLFNVSTIFRADNTKLPIEINGDDPSTEDVEKYALGLGTPTYVKDGDGKTILPTFGATNDYTFKSIDLSAWANQYVVFLSGSGRVTFNDTTLSSAASDEHMMLSAQVSEWTVVQGWNQAKFDANAVDGLLDSSFTFIDTAYGYQNGTLATRVHNGGIAKTGAVANDITFMSNMFRSKLVIGDGANVPNPYLYSTPTGTNTNNSASYVTMNAEAYSAGENVVEVLDGATVGTIYGLRSNVATCHGYKLIVDVKGGTVSGIQGVANNTALKYTGDLYLNWTGGTVTTFKATTGGHVLGGLHCYVKGQTYSSFKAGTNLGIAATASGSVDTLYITLEDCNVGSSFDMCNITSGVVTNFVNTLKGTITTTDTYAYMGAGQQDVAGNITNHIYCDLEIPTTAYFYGGLNGYTCNGKITNYIYDGANIPCYFVAGSNGTNGDTTKGIVAGGIETNVLGGTIATYFGGGALTTGAPLSSIKNVITGGEITKFYGGTGDAVGQITKIENVIGKVEEDGSYSGDAHIATFYGGNYGEALKVGTVENTFYSGKIGAADRTTDSTWSNTSNLAYCGSNHGTVGVIRNTFYGGIFNVGYFYCGNQSGTFATTVASPAEGESQINNTVYGGHFVRFAAGSSNRNVASVSTYVEGTEDSITVRSGAFYGGHGTGTSTVINNTLAGYAATSLTDDGLRKSGWTAYTGGSNGQAVGAIYNTIKNGAYTDYFYSGSNGAYAVSLENTVTKDADSEVAPEIVTFYGGSNGTQSAVGTIELIKNTIEAGQIDTFYGGNSTSAKGTSITAIENTITGGNVTNFRSGCYQVAKDTSATEDFEIEIGSITNNIGSAAAEGRPVINGFFGGNYDNPGNNANTNKFKGVYSVGSITNTFDHVQINGNSYFGDRYHKVAGVTNTINNLEFNGSNLYMGNNVGTVTGAVNTTINGLILNGNFNPDVASASITNATFNVTISENANIVVGLNGEFDVVTPIKATSVNVEVLGNFNVTQRDYWYDGRLYVKLPAELNDMIIVADEVPGTFTKADGVVTGKSTLKAEGVNFILTDRVAVRVIFDKAVAAEYENITAHANNTTIKCEIDPENENAIIVYGIGLKDFDKVISFAGRASLPADANTIIKIADFGNEINDVYKAIADFGRVFKGEATIYGLEAGATNKTEQPTVNTGFITGKNLIMSDAMGIRYYATLGEAKIEDIKVEIEGKDYTSACNFTVVNEETGEINIDFYMGIGYMDKALDVKISVGETVVLEYTEYADAIAKKIIDNQEDNALATAALIYIQAANTL